MALFYKGVGVATFLHPTDLCTTGISPHSPGAGNSVDAMMMHIARAAIRSPFVSLTRSYGIAYVYAKNTGKVFPTAANPAYVYEVEINDPPPAGVTVYDPIAHVAAQHTNALSNISYHHDGDMNFLLGVVSPATMGAHLLTPVRHPAPGGTPRPANLSIQVETFTRALRDSEILVYGTIPATCVITRYLIY
jgi:hypothetical protein